MAGPALYWCTMIEIIPTNTCPPDIAELSRRSAAFAAYAADVQLDISDGKFTPVTSWPYGAGQWHELEEVAAKAALPQKDAIRYETHLMIENPRECGELLARAGVPRIMAHLEAFESPESARAALRAWKEAGAREVGLALLIDTPLGRLAPLAAELDCVLVMSIPRLGAQGAPFDARAYDRIKELRASYPSLTIAVDGGVSEGNIAELARAGARRFGVGSAISKASDPKAAYEKLKALAEGAIQ
jgi:ribulose-phosphate 3-epimerase